MSKPVVYRGGIVTFSIPDTWREEHEPSGGATFYEDRPNSGTLRLNVLTFESQSTAAQHMALTAFPAGSFTLLPNGCPIRDSTSQFTENGEQLHGYRWEIAVPVAPRSMRIVIFTYTIVAGQESDPVIAAELAYIEGSIQAAIFSQDAGVSGSYRLE